jgi:HSP20 family molecular chaperone IbpA
MMLWQTFRRAAVRLSIALVQSYRRVTAHKQHRVDAEKIEASFDKDVLTVTLPKEPAAQKPDKKIEVTAAA